MTVLLDPAFRKKFLAVYKREARERELNQVLIERLCRVAIDLELLRILNSCSTK